MNLYILLGGIVYESNHLLGVYDSQEKADSALAAYKESGTYEFDYYEIQQRELNAFAKSED